MNRVPLQVVAPAAEAAAAQRRIGLRLEGLVFRCLVSWPVGFLQPLRAGTLAQLRGGVRWNEGRTLCFCDGALGRCPHILVLVSWHNRQCCRELAFGMRN